MRLEKRLCCSKKRSNMKRFLQLSSAFLYGLGVATFAIFCIFILFRLFIASEENVRDLPLQRYGEIACKSVDFSERGSRDWALLRVYRLKGALDCESRLVGFDKMDADAAKIWQCIVKNRDLFAPEFDITDASACKVAYKLRSWKSGMYPCEADFLLCDEACGKCYHFEFNGGAGGFYEDFPEKIF